MRTLRIEFVEPRRLLVVVWWLLLAWLLALAAFHGLQWQRRQAQLAQTAVVQAVDRTGATVTPPVQPPSPPAYTESAKQALAQLEHRWAPALRSIEEAPLAGVQILSIDVSINQLVAVTFEEPSVGVALLFVERLNARLPGWRLQSLEALASAGPPSPSAAGYRAIAHRER